MEELLYVSSQKFVTFDNNGEIISIGNSKPDVDNFIVVDYKSVSKLLSGEESTFLYEIVFDPRLKTYKLSKKVEEKSDSYNFNDDFYEFNYKKDIFDIQVRQNNVCEEWEISVDQELAEVLLEKSLYNDTKLFFSITEKNNPFILNQFIVIDFHTLIKEKTIKESFNKNITMSKKYSIYTKKMFENYSYEVINE